MEWHKGVCLPPQGIVKKEQTLVMSVCSFFVGEASALISELFY
jgi:hypothetical protein